jgi:repressor LexA
MESLKPREEEFMNFLEAYEQKHSFSPSNEEIADAMGYRSKSSVQLLLKSLKQKGLVTYQPGKARTVKSLRKPRQQHGIPFWGTIAAGGIVESFTDQPPEFYAVSEALNKPENYVLRVIGDSMIDAHICNNDIVILSRNLEVNRIKPGDIVAVHVAGEGTTLKRFYQDGADVILEPANSSPEFEMMKREASLVQVQGVLVAIHRPFLYSNLG